jgi:hypothetical protein
MKDYDFVVVGYGNAGRSAVETLQKLCPGSSIACIDPLRHSKQELQLDFYAHRCTGLDPAEQTVTTASDTALRYKHGVLVATGARGAPPPYYLFDDKARPHCCELVSTQLPDSNAKAPDQVRQTMLQQAAAGSKVGVLGSGWEAVDLVVALSLNGKTKPCLIFGASAPLCHVLPNYLSTALAKRLRARRVEVQDRTLLRYISFDVEYHVRRDSKRADVDQSQSYQNRTSKSRLQLYSARSFDFMDGSKTSMDFLVIAPDTVGSRGSAALPTTNVPSHLQDASKGRPWYQTWAKLSSSNDDSAPSAALICYKDDGRVVVNAELCACTGVYAAGSVAKMASPITGHSAEAGAGVEEARAAGRVAATNMARLYQRSIRGWGKSSISRPLLSQPIPVWRSDRFSWGCTSLSDIGLTALCVGNCDSDSLMTHGIWWSNQAAQRRMLRLLDDDEDEDKITKRQRRTIKESLKPVYGLGVVYYVDRTGRIQGVMTWGLPFAMGGHNQELNQRLVQQMKRVITTNGGFGALETEMDHIRMSNYLEDEARRMVVTSFAGHMKSRDDGASAILGQSKEGSPILAKSLPKPLHRYTQIRPPTSRMVGILKRRYGHGHGILGEDLFVRRSEENTIASTPASYFAVGTASSEKMTAKAQAMNEWNLWEQREKLFEENEARGRPPKEDPLWIRKGDDTRNMSAEEELTAAYRKAVLQSHRTR